MSPKALESRLQICPCCMEEHEVKTVQIKESTAFKKLKVYYDALYQYCQNADEYFESEVQIQENDRRLKDAYRKHEGLLTSEDIRRIREKYGITQSDLCTLLGWGQKTITRYESHQVQDKAHDSILKKIDRDPEWFLLLLDEARDGLSSDAYQRYYQVATRLYDEDHDLYLRKAIWAKYARYGENHRLQGNTKLSLDKVIDVIRYLAASKSVTSLYKVKLVKLLWYADALSFKRRGRAITGLVYCALPMGAVPIGHELIIDLKDVPCEEVDMGETYAYHFSLKGENQYPSLEDEERAIIDIVIDRLGKMSKNEIISFMHQEPAYQKTAQGHEISFEYAKYLQI